MNIAADAFMRRVMTRPLFKVLERISGPILFETVRQRGVGCFPPLRGGSVRSPERPRIARPSLHKLTGDPAQSTVWPLTSLA